MNRQDRVQPLAEPPAKQRLRLWLKLLKASRTVEDEIRRRMRNELGTTLPRFDVLSALDRVPEGLKMGEISNMLRVSNGNITTIVDRLTEEGLALRVAVEGDRRAHRVRLTPKGQKVFRKQAAAHAIWIDQILGNLEIGDVGGMIDGLDHLMNSLEEQN